MIANAMPYYQVPQSIPAPERPRAVSVAAFLLVGAAAFWLAAMIATMFAVPQYERHYVELAQSPDGGLAAVMLLAFGAAIAMLAAALFVLLGALDANGRPAARIQTWIFGGLAVGAAGLILGTGVFTGIGWHQWLMNSIAVVTLCFLPSAMLLLALPSSSAYFRRSREHRRANARRLHLARYGFPPGPTPVLGTDSGSSGTSAPASPAPN